jgi:hypothetical protein
MADGIDWKAIGLGAKDVIVGVVGAVAGAYGGSESAKAVNNAGTGIDKILGAAMPEEKTRSEKFDRADLPSKPAPPTGRAPQLAPSIETKEKEDPQSADDEQLIAADFLRGRGWSREKIRQIMGGPEEASVHQIAARETRGVRVQGARGSRVRQAPGIAVPDAERSVREVAGRRVALNSASDADAKALATAPPDKTNPEEQKQPGAAEVSADLEGKGG